MQTEPRFPSSHGRRTSLAVTAVVVALLSVAYPLRWLDGLEAKLLDLRFVIRGERSAAPRVVVVAIDDTALRNHPELPTAPDLHAELIRRLTAAQVAAIGLDTPELARPTRDNPEAFARLAAAMRESGRVVVPAVAAPADAGANVLVPRAAERFALGPGRLLKPVELQQSQLLTPRGELCAAAAGLGALNVYPDRDWTVRSAPLLVEIQGMLWPSFALELARVGQGRHSGERRLAGGFVHLGPTSLPVDEAGEAVINFAGPDETYPTVSYDELLSGSALTEELARKLRGCFVIVGSTAAALPSRLRTPYSPHMAGVEVTANVLGTVLSQRFLARGSTVHALLLTLAGALLGLLAGGIARPSRAAAVTGLALAALLAGWVGAFSGGACLPMAGPILATLLVGGTLVARSAVAAEVSRRQTGERVASRIGALAGMGVMLNSGLNREQLLTSIMVWVEEEVNCEAASLLTLAEDGRLKFEVALGPVADRLKDLRLNVGEGIVGTVVATGEPLLVPDTEKDPRFARTIAQAVDFPARSILCVPMAIPGRVVGAIEVINKRDGSLFTEPDTALLTVIAQNAAMFLEMARLYEVLERRVDFANRELRTANQRLSAEKAKIEAIVDNMADGVVATDEGGRIVLLNHAAQEMLGLSAEAAFGRSPAEALPHSDLARLFEAGVSEEMPARELTVGERDERVLRVLPALAVDEQGVAGRVAVLTDITDLRELDRTKTDMVSFVSHELKNPLTSITGFAGLIRDQAEELTLHEYAEVIGRQAGRMYRLIEDFLNIARIDTGRPLEMHWEEGTGLRGLIEEAIAAESPGRPDHHFVVEVRPDTPTLRADPDKLYQILINLINNAVKYSPSGGAVIVRAAPEDGRAVHLAVTDQGLGIAPEHMQHLFKRFRRVRDGSGDRVEGTGLGLFVTRHLVRAHGGRIWAESTPGQGSTFHVVLPVAGGAPDEHDPED